MTAIPKPTKRSPRPRARLGARRRSRAEVAARSSRRKAKAALALPPPPVPEGTKHSRRDREWGRMAFYGSLWCMLRDLARTGNIEPHLVSECMDCGVPDGMAKAIEVAHLGERPGYRRAPDWTTAPLCWKHHKAIDGKEGGKAPWYVALGRERQLELRQKLWETADHYWRMLTPATQGSWNDLARRTG